MRTFSSSLTSILTPVIATGLLAFTNIQTVIAVDLTTFGLAFGTLLFGIKVPDMKPAEEGKEKVLQAAKSGLRYLKHNRGILDLILFLAAINLTASMYNAALPAMLLSVDGGGENAYGMVNMVSGLAMLAGSIVATILPIPKSRVRVICNTLLLAMSTENFFCLSARVFPSGVWVLSLGGSVFR